MLAIYIALKLAGYITWSTIGAVSFRRQGSPMLTGIALGTVRLVIGWATGLVVALVALSIASGSIPLFYFAVLAVVRWFEWGAIELMLAEDSATPSAFVGGFTRGGRLWRVGGVAVSYLADAPFLLVGGFPGGRIFC